MVDSNSHHRLITGHLVGYYVKKATGMLAWSARGVKSLGSIDPPRLGYTVVEDLAKDLFYVDLYPMHESDTEPPCSIYKTVTLAWLDQKLDSKLMTSGIPDNLWYQQKYGFRQFSFESMEDLFKSVCQEFGIHARTQGEGGDCFPLEQIAQIIEEEFDSLSSKVASTQRFESYSSVLARQIACSLAEHSQALARKRKLRLPDGSTGPKLTASKRKLTPKLLTRMGELAKNGLVSADDWRYCERELFGMPEREPVIVPETNPIRQYRWAGAYYKKVN